MNKSLLIKEYLSKLSLYDLLSYRLKLCSGEPNEDIELDISDLFKYPTRLETSYFDNWQKDLFKSLYLSLDGEFNTEQEVHQRIVTLFSEKVFSDKDERTLVMFDNFLTSVKTSNVSLIHASIQRKP
jgi:hypothetical protein